MKNFSKVFLPLAGLLLLASPVVRAADTTTQPATEQPERRFKKGKELRDDGKKMAKELNLTPQQQIQVDAIRKETGDALKALRQDSSLTEDQKRAKGRELRATTEDQIQAVLTPEQKAKAKELREKHGGHRGGPDKPPAI